MLTSHGCVCTVWVRIKVKLVLSYQSLLGQCDSRIVEPSQYQCVTYMKHSLPSIQLSWVMWCELHQGCGNIRPFPNVWREDKTIINTLPTPTKIFKTKTEAHWQQGHNLKPFCRTFYAQFFHIKFWFVFNGLGSISQESTQDWFWLVFFDFFY